jgi:hypothetical protein
MLEGDGLGPVIGATARYCSRPASVGHPSHPSQRARRMRFVRRAPGNGRSSSTFATRTSGNGTAILTHNVRGTLRRALRR